jgi:hypothetical protein
MEALQEKELNQCNHCIIHSNKIEKVVDSCNRKGIQLTGVSSSSFWTRNVSCSCIGISRGRWDWLATWTSCFVLFGVHSTSLLVRWSSFDAFQDFTMTPRPHVLNNDSLSQVVLFKFTSMCPSSPDTMHFRVLFPSKSHWNASINSSIHQPFQPSIHCFHPSIHH